MTGFPTERERMVSIGSPSVFFFHGKKESDEYRRVHSQKDHVSQPAVPSAFARDVRREVYDFASFEDKKEHKRYLGYFNEVFVIGIGHKRVVYSGLSGHNRRGFRRSAQSGFCVFEGEGFT